MTCCAPSPVLACSVHAACKRHVSYDPYKHMCDWSHINHTSTHAHLVLSVRITPSRPHAVQAHQRSRSTFVLSCVLQARAVGDELVVGLVPDREILRCKGPPVQNQQERKIMVDAVKWVGEVIEGKRCVFAFDPQSAKLVICPNQLSACVNGCIGAG